MQTSSHWNVLIGLFHFHFNKMSPPLLFSSPHRLFCPLHFSQAVLYVDTLASSRLPANGSVNSVICSSVWRDEGRRVWMGDFVGRVVAAGQEEDRKLKGEEMRKMKGKTWKQMGREKKVEISWMLELELWQSGWDVFLIRSHYRLTPTKQESKVIQNMAISTWIHM